MANYAYSQSFYDINTIQKIEISFTQTNWDYQLDTAKAGSDGYIMAQSVTVNGVVFDSVGVKYKGNSTYQANQTKNPFHIELDTYKDHIYEGYSDIKLSNVAKDPSFVREVLSYDILRQYMDAPLSNYANVYVNSKLIGLYSNSESVGKKFVDKYFYSKKNTLVKCNPIDGAGPGTSAIPNLVYLGTDSSAYYAAYEMKSDVGWKQLIALCDTLKNNTNAIEKILDVDRTLWMLAFDNVLVNLDSYIGGFAQNYYLYQDDNGIFIPVVWDLNESFGTFSQTGTINLQNTTAKKQMTHLLHLNDAAWPLVNKLLSIPRYKRMYVAHMKTMIEENFSNSAYYTTGQKLQTIIDNAVMADPNKFFTYTQYQSNLTSDVGGGMGSTPGIKNLMDGRSTYLLSQNDFTAISPVISNVVSSNPNPSINSVVYINANIETADDVWLGYRFSKKNPFTKVKMADDGLHDDGIAGDKIYGIDVKLTGDFVEYYIYAENVNAGKFSPQRAEHEFYTLNVQIATIQKGDLVINELMADNGTTKADAAGEFDDWIELYNNTANTLSLDNLFLSDSYSSTQKWKFPDGKTIEPFGYLIVWADDGEDPEELHAAFKLSTSGERVILSYADGYVVDSISFGAQTKDVSFLRCPNGTGNFEKHAPSFNDENCKTVSTSEEVNENWLIYPNPTVDRIFIENDKNEIQDIKVYQSSGQQIVHLQTPFSQLIDIDLFGNKPGIYLVKINNNAYRKIVLLP